MVGCASGSKTHMNIQSKEGALFLTTKKLIISAQSNSWFLSTITGELFLLTPLAARRFSCLLKTLFIFGAGCKLVRLVLNYNLPVVPTFISDFYQLLSLSWESFLICDKFGSMLSLSVSMLSKMASKSALSSNCFWLPLNFSCTTSLSILLLCSICFPLYSNVFSRKSLNMEKTWSTAAELPP